MEDVVTDKEHIENDIEKAEALNNEAEGNKEVPKIISVILDTPVLTHRAIDPFKKKKK